MTSPSPFTGKIFGIGLSRTGTQSLTAALQMLGFDAVHWRQTVWFLEYDWHSIHPRKSDFEKHQAFADTPIALTYKELDAMFPGSRFILTTRDIDSWCASVTRHIAYTARNDWTLAADLIHTELYGEKPLDGPCLQIAYEKHLADVRIYFQDRLDDLLVLNICSGAGWEDLCRFLDCPVPAAPFPLKGQSSKKEPGKKRSLLVRTRKRIKAGLTNWYPRWSRPKPKPLSEIALKYSSNCDNPILLFSTIRNERERLPAFLEYYRALKVDHFFIVDNDSTDNAQDFLLDQSDVSLFHTTEPFSQSQCGNRWRKELASRFAPGCWCLFIDADELLIYPHGPSIPLPTLCDYLDREKTTALYSILLDMYPDGPLEQAHFSANEKPWETCPMFELDTIRLGQQATGGVRSRLFDVAPCLCKFVLFKNLPGVEIAEGAHVQRGAIPSALRGAVLHFKFDHTFWDSAAEEARRKQHWQAGAEYQKYAQQITRLKETSFVYPGSQRFRNADQLRQLGLLRTTKDFESFVNNLPGPCPFPQALV